MFVKIARGIARVGLRMSTMKLGKGPRIARYYMYDRLSQYSEPRPRDQRVLSISDSEHLGRLLGFSDDQINNTTYPAVDILDLPFRDGEFDAVVSDQVLEHVEGSPQLAVEETFRVLKPDGIALHTTCFINPIHHKPQDFWRFTPDALKFLVDGYGEIIDVGGWGNPFVWIYLGLGLRFEPVPHARWHPVHWLAMENHSRWPMSTWVLARKLAVNRD